MDFATLLNMKKFPEEKPENKTKGLKITESYQKSLSAYYADYFTASCFATRIADGEVVEESVVVNVFKSLAATYAAYVQQRKVIEPDGKPVSLSGYGVPCANVNTCIEGNRLVGEANQTGDLAEYEHGMWLLFCCKG